MRPLTLFVSAVLFTLSVAAEESPPLVGDLGNPDQVVVVGATTFTAGEIVNELFADLDVVNAAYPTRKH